MDDMATSRHLLDEARQAYDRGEYARSSALAQEARRSAELIEDPQRRFQVIAEAGSLELRGYSKTGSWEAAEEVWRSVSDVGEAAGTLTFGLLKDAMSQVRALQGRYEEAYRTSLEALSLRSESLPPDAAECFESCVTGGALAFYVDSPAKADELFEQAEAIVAKYGDQLLDRDLLNYHNNRGFLLSKRGNFADAAKALEQAEALSRKLLGDEHPKTLSLQVNLAKHWLDLGSSQRAAQLLEAVAEAQRSLGLGAASLAATLQALARCHLDLKDDRAEPTLRQALESMQDLDDLHEGAIYTRLMLARLMREQGRPEEAAAELDRLENLLAGRDETSARILMGDVLVAQCALAESAGRPEEALAKAEAPMPSGRATSEKATWRPSGSSPGRLPSSPLWDARPRPWRSPSKPWGLIPPLSSTSSRPSTRASSAASSWSTTASSISSCPSGWMPTPKAAPRWRSFGGAFSSARGCSCG